MNFDEYCEAIKLAFKVRGIKDPPSFDPECWRDSYDNGDTPMEAVDTELSYWND